MSSYRRFFPAAFAALTLAALGAAHAQQAGPGPMHQSMMLGTQLEHRRSDELKTLANRIIDEQQKNIAQLDEWLARRK